MLETNKIAVTGLGVVCAIAQDTNTLWQKLLDNSCAVKNWDDLKALDFKYAHAARVEHFDCDPLQRGFAFSEKAIEQAIEQANNKTDRDWGLFLGTTMGESAAFEQMAENKRLDPRDYTGYGICKRLKERFSQIDHFECFATACAAGNYALKSGMDALFHNKVNVAIVGGVDPFSKIAMTGFSRNRAMSPSGICKPFDSERDGMILGEGAGFLILERLETARDRGAKVLALLEDCVLSCDAYHPTAPKPDASGIIDCFNNLLERNKIAKIDVDWISAHGTGTKLSDRSEAQAISKVFSKTPYVSSIKPKIGHTLGAASAIEAIVSVLSIEHQTVPPTLHYKTPEFDILVPKRPIHTTVHRVLNCAYAFGGLNSITSFSSWH